MIPARTVQIVSSPFRTVWNVELVDGVASFWIRSGDTGRPLVVLLKNMDGSDVVVPAGTQATFTMTNKQTGFAVSGTATLGNGPNSTNNNQATYPFIDPADTAQPGLYDATWQLTYPNAGGVETFPTRTSRSQASWTVDTVFTIEVVRAPGDVGLSG